MKQSSKIVKKFMEDTGYNDVTGQYGFYGVKKNRKNNNREWTYKKPSQMLKDFIKWQKENK